MRWLWFVATLICFAVVFKTTSIGLAVVCLLGALITGLIGVFAVASGRIDSRSRDASALLGPDELRRIREIETRRRAAAAGHAGVASVAVAGAALAADRAEPTRDAEVGNADDLSGGDASDGGSGSAD